MTHLATPAAPLAGTNARLFGAPTPPADAVREAVRSVM